MYPSLHRLAAQGQEIRVGLAGTGFMAQGIANQLGKTPGISLAFVGGRNIEAAEQAARRAAAHSGMQTAWGNDAAELLQSCPVDVLIEATCSVGAGLRHCMAALEHGAHLVLANTELDLAMGDWLATRANAHGRVCTSDSGDQHGVLARLVDECRLFGMRPVLAGNIKGFLNPEARAEELGHEAAIRGISAQQCCAFTDGTKLNIEMALLANGCGFRPLCTGMQGPRATDVHEALECFDLDAMPPEGAVDYLLGAEPGGGVFVIGECTDPFQRDYLRYLKLGDGPYYVLPRAYHLCPMETAHAVAAAVLEGRPVLQPGAHRRSEVYAFAKRSLRAGEPITQPVGGDQLYGRIADASLAEHADLVPLLALEPAGGESAVVSRDVIAGQPLRQDALVPPATPVWQWRMRGIPPAP